MKKISLMLACTLLVLLTACQPTPEKSVIISKNNGEFDANVIQPAEENHLPKESKSLQFSDTFQSTDGSVTFHISVDNSIQTSNMPVVEVVPHFLTGEDVHNIATALFGQEAVFFEAEPSSDEHFSKQEIRDQISRWSPYTSAEKIGELFPNNNPNAWASYAETMQECIAYLSTEFLNSAVEDYERPLCQWQFHNSSYYNDRTTDLNSSTSFQENEEISAWIPMDNGMYSLFEAARRNKADYKLNNVYVTSAAGGPLGIDSKIFCAENLRTTTPTQEQIDMVVEKAQKTMNTMGLGSWEIGSARIEEYSMGDCTEYRICVDAFPVLGGVMALDLPQLNNLKSKELYASNYYLTEANFSFSANGELVDFTLYSPIDIKQVLNENVKTLTMEELFTRAKEHMMLSDLYSYGGDLGISEEGDYCNVCVSNVQYGLARTKVPNTEDSYYYVPAVVFSGNIDLFSQNSGEPFYSIENTSLLLLNAVDGSIISINNE